MEEWESYFKERLGGVRWRVRREGGRVREEGDEEEEISNEELNRVIPKLKKGKSAGRDDIVTEVLKYRGGEVREWIWEICNRVWKVEGWPDEWKERILVLVLKKGKGVKVEEYRGVTLMQTAYKIYAAVLADRLREEVESKAILPPSQAGFRKGGGDNGSYIYPKLYD